jgi:phosphatidylglycerol---prolipoprotein diacylglyceryl transferase
VFPVLFNLGPITVYTYGVLLAVSYLLGLWLAVSRAKRWKLDANRVMDLGIYIIIAALVGAKLLLLVVDFDHYWNNPAEIVSLLRSGGVFYGGLILAVAVAFWYIPRHGLPMWSTCDAFTPGIALGHVTGRLGCFAAGCCYGKATDAPWAVIFTNPLSTIYQDRVAQGLKPLEIAVHPTQLYESGAELLILVLLLVTERKGRPFPGRTFWSYMFLYAVSRYVIEFYRGDPRGEVPFLHIPTSQFISLVLGPLSLLMLVWLSRMVPTSPQAARHRRRAAA